MEKIDYEILEIVDLDSMLTITGDSACTDNYSEEIGGNCPEDADDEDP